MIAHKRPILIGDCGWGDESVARMWMVTNNLSKDTIQGVTVWIKY
jgi:hypothetical protein